MARESWNKYKSYKGRQTNTLEPKQRFLIACEGEKTEPNYFQSFRVPKDVIVDIKEGAGTHLSVVREAMRARDASHEPYDQVWSVFDRDKDVNNPKNAQNFNAALQLALKESIHVAYSNDAFELWYLLHFNYHDTAMGRHDYVTKLKELLADGYEKKDPLMYEKLESRMEVAIKNAERLISQYKTPDPLRDDPSTTVHLLVKELNLYI